MKCHLTSNFGNEKKLTTLEGGKPHVFSRNKVLQLNISFCLIQYQAKAQSEQTKLRYI